MMKHNRKNERGVTFMVAAFTLLAIIAMAAISVDIAELYVARGEAQRAADAAALAGAKMFVKSGFTTLQSTGVPEGDITNICQSGGPGLPAAANTQAEAAASQNNIAGQPAVVTQIQCPPANGNFENPTISVSVTNTGVPTFFARIWGNTGSTVNATATAEAYNPSGSPSFPETASISTSVKPWLLPNCDPTVSSPCSTPYFVDPATGNIKNNGAFIGKIVELNIITSGHGGGKGNASVNALTFYPLNVSPTTPTICPSCASGSNYTQNIACSSQVQFSCGQPIGPSSSPLIRIQNGSVGSLSGQTRTGGRCLIHVRNDGLGLGQDIIAPPTAPAVVPIITGGDSNPNSS